MFANGEVALDAQSLVRVERVRTAAFNIAVHDFQVFFRELERARFKVYAAGRRGEHEIEVDVYQVSIVVQQNIAVVTILYLQQVGKDGISRQ